MRRDAVGFDIPVARAVHESDALLQENATGVLAAGVPAAGSTTAWRPLLLLLLLLLLPADSGGCQHHAQSHVQVIETAAPQSHSLQLLMIMLRKLAS